MSDPVQIRTGSPTDAPVVQLETRVRDLEVATFCTVFVRRVNFVVEKWPRQGGPTPTREARTHLAHPQAWCRAEIAHHLCD